MTAIRTVSRIPWFTLSMAGALIAAATATGTLAAPLELAWRRTAGFGPVHLARLELVRIFTSAFLTPGGWRFFSTLAMLVLCAWAAEWVHGTWRAATGFWLVHLATSMAQSIACLVIFREFEHPLTQALVEAHDVGPSAGYYGCLGLAVATLPRPARRAVVAAVGAWLLLRLATALVASVVAPHSLSGAVAHVLAFPLGLVLAGTKPFQGNRQRVC